MHLSHLGLLVRDERRSQRFYPAYFGFDLATAQEYEDGTVIMRNADGFDLALHPVGHVEPSPPLLHAGFKAAEPADVRALMERVQADGVTIAERNEEAAYVAFKCLDPDSHRIEVYWEPVRCYLTGRLVASQPATFARRARVGLAAPGGRRGPGCPAGRGGAGRLCGPGPGDS
jgi:catechol 2,3-dioxygenase-like lactoylglutathione lyase family enzyme